MIEIPKKSGLYSPEAKMARQKIYWFTKAATFT